MNNLILQKTNFSFFADKTDILIKNIFGELEAVKIKNGDIKIRLLPEISLQSNFLTNLKYKDKSSEHYFKLIKNYQYAKDVINLEASINNDLLINFDKTYKVKNYSFTSNGKI